MTAIRLERFMGMAPKLSNRLLPDTAATSTQNARLLSGELRGIKQPSRIHRFAAGPIRNVHRLFASNGDPIWLGLSNADSDIVKGPLVNDSYNRHYWTGEQAYPAYNSADRIDNGDPPYKLGTPTPTAAASLAITGGSGEVETRAYTYTFVNSWGEESAPAPIVSNSGFINGSWDLTALPSSAPDMTNRLAITNKRVYRTVTGQATVAYFFVAEITLAATTYSDTSTNAQVALNSILQSFTWSPPPVDLEGLVAHPGGFLAGFVGTDIYFSERYRPHAWPAGYVLSVEHAVVGLSIYNNMLTALTKGHPYFFQGGRPDNLSPIKSQVAQPCLAKSSIASTFQGVMYASQDGLVIYNEAGPIVVTSPILSHEEWHAYSPPTIRGAIFGEQYLGYYSTNKAFKYSPSEALSVFVEIDKFDAVDNLVTDSSSGDLWLLRNNDVYEWEPHGGAPMYYTWLSKVFDFTRPINFGAFMVKSEADTITQTVTDAAVLTAYNTEIFTADPPDALNPINFTPMNGRRSFPVNVGTTPEGIDEIPQNKFPIGGGPIHNLADATSSQTSVSLTVYADGRELFTRFVDSGVTYRMPSGFKAAIWQFKLVGNANVYSLAVAETPKELENV